MNVSIAMATYNGEKYIREQLDSILCQLKDGDEIVISDDGSTDNTCDIIKQYYSSYPLVIRLENGPNQGPFRNFENAILCCRNEIIYLSDQDDIWEKNKIKTVNREFLKGKMNLVLHNGVKFGDDGISGMITKYHSGIASNIIKSSYYGCCMAFRKSYINQYIPFGVDGITHDQLIGLLAESDRTVRYIDKNLIKHRIHGKNFSQKKSIRQKIKNRRLLIEEFFLVKKKRLERELNMCRGKMK